MTNPLALIIEDDPKLGDIFALSLQAAEFETEIVTDGGKARTRLTEIVPHIIVLDLHLPQVSGEQLLRQIKADQRLNSTKVMLTTADAQAAEYLQAESDLVLLKPISPAQLRDLAKRLRPTF